MGRLRDRERGEPGEPGEPGETGAHGGGAGGRGGRGGRGARGGVIAVEHHGILIFTMLVAIALSIGTLILLSRVNDQKDQISNLERADVKILKLADANHQASIKLIYETDYRLCLRQQVVRVAINQDRDHDEPSLPLYDCTPDLTGGQAKRLTPAQTAKFIEQIKHAGFTP